MSMFGVCTLYPGMYHYTVRDIAKCGEGHSGPVVTTETVNKSHDESGQKTKAAV